MERFNTWEKRLFTITLSIFLFSLVSFAIIAISVDHIAPFAEVLANFFLFLFFSVLLLFVITIGRIIYYLTKLRKKEKRFGIKRSLISLLLHPVTIIILYTLIFITAISGCTVN